MQNLINLIVKLYYKTTPTYNCNFSYDRSTIGLPILSPKVNFVNINISYHDRVFIFQAVFLKIALNKILKKGIEDGS